MENKFISLNMETECCSTKQREKVQGYLVKDGDPKAYNCNVMGESQIQIVRGILEQGDKTLFAFGRVCQHKEPYAWNRSVDLTAIDISDQKNMEERFHFAINSDGRVPEKEHPYSFKEVSKSNPEKGVYAKYLDSDIENLEFDELTQEEAQIERVEEFLFQEPWLDVPVPRRRDLNLMYKKYKEQESARFATGETIDSESKEIESAH